MQSLLEDVGAAVKRLRTQKRRARDLDWTASTNALSWFVLVNFSAKSVELNTHDAAVSQK